MKVIATFGIKTSGRRNDGINIKAPYGSPVKLQKMERLYIEVMNYQHGVILY